MMDFTAIWNVVQNGGDLAIYAILYYVHSVNAKVNMLEVKYSSLKSWVNRLDDKIDRITGNEGKL